MWTKADAVNFSPWQNWDYVGDRKQDKQAYLNPNKSFQTFADTTG